MYRVLKLHNSPVQREIDRREKFITKQENKCWVNFYSIQHIILHILTTKTELNKRDKNYN